MLLTICNNGKRNVLSLIIVTESGAIARKYDNTTMLDRFRGLSTAIAVNIQINRTLLILGTYL